MSSRGNTIPAENHRCVSTLSLCEWAVRLRGRSGSSKDLKSLSIGFLAILGHSPWDQLNVTLKSVTLVITTLGDLL